MQLALQNLLSSEQMNGANLGGQLGNFENNAMNGHGDLLMGHYPQHNPDKNNGVPNLSMQDALLSQQDSYTKLFGRVSSGADLPHGHTLPQNSYSAMPLDGLVQNSNANYAPISGLENSPGHFGLPLSNLARYTPFCSFAFS